MLREKKNLRFVFASLSRAHQETHIITFFPATRCYFGPHEEKSPNNYAKNTSRTSPNLTVVKNKNKISLQRTPYLQICFYADAFIKFCLTLSRVRWWLFGAILPADLASPTCLFFAHARHVAQKAAVLQWEMTTCPVLLILCTNKLNEICEKNAHFLECIQ